ncbi:hypothetical protein OG884_10900 [Streptosporangium sp. NBC_01755]|uniref:hypothetical protein n=1 Tax=unclassified Streptosporangium TaxID=2632669 RepID=UPI002DD814B8|nr:MULTISPECIES: hypothetical protein [unclassified Streptosporangium]WSA26186.1 hypothetical protein OIE13_35780 [Streptosporangium sp. NBC_01810]WSD02385.1 hypothetical protein OG884_10900 [Streptosporangium sp. NBC_01755]
MPGWSATEFWLIIAERIRVSSRSSVRMGSVAVMLEGPTAKGGHRGHPSVRGSEPDRPLTNGA